MASVRWILRNPAYAGRALTNRTRVAPARQRKSAMLPAGPGLSHAPRPPEDWIEVPVPQIVSEETFAQVQAKLDANQQSAARNTRHEYLLRALVSCGACRLSCTARQSAAGYRYYLCRGHTDALRAAHGQRCSSRYIPADQLDELVWADLCALLTGPAQVTHALQRARGGAWLPQELQARQAAIRQALGQLDRQQQRLLDVYLAEVVGLPELELKRQELDRRRAALQAQQRQLETAAGQRWNLPPSPTASRHSARPSGLGWPPPPSPNDGSWPSCSSTAWSSPAATSRSATCCQPRPTGRTGPFASCGKTISMCHLLPAIQARSAVLERRGP